MSGDSFLPNLLVFARLLRAAGLMVAPDQLADLGRVLERIGVERREDVYYAARALLVRRHDELALFDRAFEMFFRIQGRPQQAVIPPGQAPAARAMRPTSLQSLSEQRARQLAKETGGAPQDEVETVRQYSPDEVLHRKNFAQFTPEEMRRARELMEQFDWRLGRRRTRRRRSSQSGAEVDFPQIMRRNLRYGGELFHLPRREHRFKPRPVVVLADISGSMERYTRMVLHWLHALSHGSERIEVFTFGTRLTRITQSLRKRSVDAALARAAQQVSDWSGGTRIGDTLKTFNFAWARRVLHGGAVVLIISDGWDRGDLDLLKREMDRLQRSCARLIWLNPLLGDVGFTADAHGMLVALPFVDDFLPVHNLTSLAELVSVLNDLRVERPARKQRPRVIVPTAETVRAPDLMPLPQMGTTNYVRRTLTLRVQDGAPRVRYEENP